MKILLILFQIALVNTVCLNAAFANRIELSPKHINMNPSSMHRVSLLFHCDQPSRKNTIQLPKQLIAQDLAITKFIQQSQICKTSPIELKLTLDSNLMSTNQTSISAVKLKQEVVAGGGVFSAPEVRTIISDTIQTHFQESTWDVSEILPGNILRFDLNPVPQEMIENQAHTFRLTFEIDGIDQKHFIPPSFIHFSKMEFSAELPKYTVTRDAYHFPTLKFEQDWTLFPKQAGNFKLILKSPPTIDEGELKEQNISFDVKVVSSRANKPEANLSKTVQTPESTNKNNDNPAENHPSMLFLWLSLLLNLLLCFYLFKDLLINLLQRAFVNTKDLAFDNCVRACKNKQPLMTRYYLHEWLTGNEMLTSIPATTAQIIALTRTHVSPSALLILDRACFNNGADDAAWNARSMLLWLNDYKLIVDEAKSSGKQS